MLNRGLALFFACLLLWSGLSSFEPLALARADNAVVDAGTPWVPPGSVADHHLDDQPTQAPQPAHASTDGQVDLPALLKAAPVVASAACPASPLPGQAASLRATPCLAGLLRPPRGNAVVAA